MRIGFLTIEHPWQKGGGGIAAYLRAIIPALVRRGHTVTVISLEGREAIEAEDDGTISSFFIPVVGWHWYLSKIPYLNDWLTFPLREFEWSQAFLRGVRQAQAEHHLDLIEVHEAGASLLYKTGVPYIVRLHGSEYVFRRYTGQPITRSVLWNHHLQLAAMQRAMAITSPSRYQATAVLGDTKQFSAVSVVPNPLDPTFLQAAKNIGCHGKKTILYVGRIALVKGVLPFLEATRHVFSKEDDSQVILAGPWQLSQLPATFGLKMGEPGENKQITWLGPVGQDRLFELYSQAAVVVVPSYYETFGITAIEAMAFGLPVVGTFAGGLTEVVEDGVTGLLVPPGDPQALAGAIIRLLQNPDLRQRLGQAGQERVLAEFTVERVVEETLAIYHRVATKG